MKVRRYFANSMREALEAVRREQGSDALILSNRTVDGGVELIVAAGEIEPAVVERFTPRARAGAEEAAPRSEPVASTLWTHPETVVQMQRELGAIKTLIEQQMSGFGWQDLHDTPTLQPRLLHKLFRLGIAPHVARQLSSASAAARDFDDAWQQVLDGLAAKLSVRRDPLREGGIAAFCGATGVGKTTLISKLAARHALQHGTDAVAVISADEQRLGAHQQLMTFGRLLGIQVEVARDRAGLCARLDALSGKSLILVDLPGLALGESSLGLTPGDLVAANRPIDLYLVVSATTDYLALNRSVRALAGVPLAGCCLSKLDEAAGFGAALSMLVESGLPLAYVSDGAQIPDDNLELTLGQFMQRAEQLGLQHPAPAVMAAHALSA